MKNGQVAKALRDIGFLTEVEDAENAQFKSRAYYRAADSIEALEQDVAGVYEKGGINALLELPGIGKAIAAKIEEYLKTGRIRHLDELKEKIPIDIGQLGAIEGVGPKTLKAIYEKLKVTDMAGLEKAALEGRLKTVPGITARKEQDILKKIEFTKKNGGRSIIGEVWPLAKKIEARLKGLEGVRHAALAGSARRMKETIGDLDYIVCASEPENVMDFFVKMPEVEEVKSRGPAKAFVRLAGGIDCDLLAVPEESWGSALLYFTGNKEHNVELRRIAIARGLRLNEWGAFENNDRRVAGASEEEVYKALGLAWIAPEMRENAGEIDLAAKGRLPSLVEYGSLRGDLQVHSDNSDGTATMEEMALAAKEFGLDYIAITDHTKSLAMAGGLDEQELLDQAQKIAELNDRLDGIRVLSSAEVNIGKDGSLDIANNVLDKLDIVGAAIHSHFGLSMEEQTARLVNAAKNPSVDIIFHPTGRLINRREGYPVDIARLTDVAKDTNTALEIDAHYNRLDLKDEYVRMAVRKGVKLTIDSDAHHPVHYAFLQFGIGQARRGWATAADVLNTMPADRLLKALK
ncbi:DNA polymerase/3'-5' exonuclease PolX [Nitrososphaera viennensis]|uniref:DNA polymerase beta n=2 Tax=Nitrososphaera viennensis TaxID=1034015 RepID=A0A060HHM4_9ARCH|nr:DNA polymerase/3'-5' exonuclease PolX [Nitrososphaera viennensis]AIC16104.1 DNA polymerase X family [Nitrososphaera viennensis EN76]UVS68069.1 DNA polymerase/3'-5' exonuclease PolX [Nitrososphaera viennensis]